MITRLSPILCTSKPGRKVVLSTSTPVNQYKKDKRTANALAKGKSCGADFKNSKAINF